MNPKIQPILIGPREAIEKIFGERMESAVLFGSYAHSQADEESDMDVPVVFCGVVNPSGEISPLVDEHPERRGGLMTPERRKP